MSQSIRLENGSELRVLDLIANETIFVSGDSAGAVRVTENMYKDCGKSPGCGHPKTPTLTSQVMQGPMQVHASEITAIASAQRLSKDTLVAMGSRDRTVQIFRFANAILELLQTVDGHSSSITDVLFLRDGNCLTTSSSDRTIMIHTLSEISETTVFAQSRIVSFKSTPMTFSAPAIDSENRFLVSCADKRIYKCNSSSGHQEESINPYDKNGEPVLLNHVSVHTVEGQGQTSVIIGVSGAEKAIRVHDYHSGAELSCETAHVGGVSSYASVCSKDKDGLLQHMIRTTGFDSTIHFWSLHRRQRDFKEEQQLSTLSSPIRPLRKVLFKPSGARKFSVLSSSHAKVESPTNARVEVHPSDFDLSIQEERRSKHETSLQALQVLQSHDSAPTPPTSPGPHGLSHDLNNTPLQQSRFTMKADLQNTDLDVEAQELCIKLSAYRNMLQTPGYLRKEMISALKNELNLTMISIRESPSFLPETTEEEIDYVLSCYSERLKKLLEDKILAAAGPKAG